MKYVSCLKTFMVSKFLRQIAILNKTEDILFLCTMKRQSPHSFRHTFW